jgi:lysophospholipase L1-like esterase
VTDGSVTVIVAAEPPDCPAMAERTRAIARLAVLAAPALALGAGCSSEREASSAPPVSEVAVAGSVGAAPSTSAEEVIDVDTVAMVGDSITVGSTEELQEAFAGIGLPDAEIDAQSGRRMVEDNGGITSCLDGIAAVLAEGGEPDLWIVALGSNDVANYRAEEYPAAINELLAAIPADAPLVWVDCYLTNYEDESAAFDETLRQVLAERGNAAVVDWASIAPQDGVLADNVHPSGFGRTEFARRVTEAVTDWTT